MSRAFVLSALIYAILGMLLGIHMAASHNHVQFVTHAHILLAGFVVSFIYGLCHKLWLKEIRSLLSRVQFFAHQIGVFVLSLGLFLLYGGLAAPEKVEPALSVGSVAVLLAMILMTAMFLKVKASE